MRQKAEFFLTQALEKLIFVQSSNLLSNNGFYKGSVKGLIIAV